MNKKECVSLETVYCEKTIAEDYLNCARMECESCTAYKELKGFNNTTIRPCDMLTHYAELLLEKIKTVM